MRVLVVDAFAETDDDRGAVGTVLACLRAGGHEVDHHRLASELGDVFMSEPEHRAYETDGPLLGEDTRRAADLVGACDALVFCYPTTLFGVPPRLKSWLERVMVMGVAFRLDDKRRIRPALTHVRRLGVVTTTPHGRRTTWQARDLGKRTIMWTLRMNCHALCRRTHVRIGSDGDPHGAVRSIERRFRRW